MARTAKKLSVKKIAKLTRPGRYSDGDGLSVQITKPDRKGNGGGVRSWLFRYELRGRERWMGLGPLRFVSLDEARKKADAARKLLEMGTDPLDAAQVDRDAAEEARKLAAIEKASRITFADAAQQFYAKQRPEWSNLKHAKQFLSTLKKYVFPKLGELPVASIDAPLILSVLTPIWETKTVTASRIRARIENILDWATASKYRTGDNPAKLVATLLPRKSRIAKVTHFKAMAYDEVPAFMAELPKAVGVPPKALEFLILTAARSGEVTGARWDEIDFENKIWTVPAERMKMRLEHRVPLVDRAIQILKSLPIEGDLVFVGARKGRAIGDKVLAELIETMGKQQGKQYDATVHGFRSSFRDWSAERTAFPRDVCEYALAHRAGGTEGSYKRSDLLEKRRPLMAMWAKFCLTLKRDAIVTPIGKRKAGG